jgi:hypothetical protein
MRDADKAVKPLIKGMMETQMFAYLIQQRIEESSYSAVFFDQAVRALNSLQLNSLQGDKRGGPISIVLKQGNSTPASNDICLYEYVDCIVQYGTAFFVSLKPPTISELVKKKRSGDKKLASNSFEEFLGPIDPSGSRGLIGARQELSQQADCYLDDRCKGPLIIPGPSRPSEFTLSPMVESLLLSTEEDRELDSNPDNEDSCRPSSFRYRYSGGWPSLDVSLLEQVHGREGSARKGLEAVCSLRQQSIEKVTFIHSILNLCLTLFRLAENVISSFGTRASDPVISSLGRCCAVFNSTRPPNRRLSPQ